MSAKTIYNALRAAGMTAEGACAVLGNMQAESGLHANIAQRGMTKLSDAQYTAAANNGLLDFARDGVGYGLCQWTYSTRKAALLSFAREKGVSVGDEEMQTRFCIRELRTDYATLWKRLTTEHDLLALTEVVCTVYERPAHNNVQARYEYAQKHFADFSNNEPSPSSDEKQDAKEFPPDPSVMVIQMVMGYNGYWKTPDGQKSPEFFSALREFVDDMEKC